MRQYISNSVKTWTVDTRIKMLKQEDKHIDSVDTRQDKESGQLEYSQHCIKHKHIWFTETSEALLNYKKNHP